MRHVRLLKKPSSFVLVKTLPPHYLGGVHKRDALYSAHREPHSPQRTVPEYASAISLLAASLQNFLSNR
jgi:hypothetical protein